MSIAALVRSMAAAGAPPEAIALAIEAIEGAQAEVDAIRAKARDKKRTQRAEAAERRDGEGTVPGQSRDKVGTVPDMLPSPSSPNDNNLTPSTHTPETHTPRAKAGHRMPADWQPQPLTGELGKAVANWPPGALDRERERFRDWALSTTGPNAKKSDWQAAWRNWIRKAEDEGRYRNGQQNGTNQRLAGHRGGSASGFGSTVDAFADFVADLTPH